MGDSIFHCHLYPHFAEGCWALYRVHDVLEDGTGITPDGIGVNSILPLPDHIAGCYRWCRGGRHDHAETAR